MKVPVQWRRPAATLTAIVGPSIATAVIDVINRHVLVPNISLLYLPAILLAAVYYGTASSLIAATVSVLEYDFFLLRPLYTFSINQAEDILAFTMFLAVAVLTSQLAAGARARAESAERRATESRTLYELGQALMSGGDVADVLQAMTRRIVDVFGVERCAILVPDPAGGLRLAVQAPDEIRRDRASLATASWVYEKGKQVSLPADDVPVDGGHRSYVPLRTADRVLGVMEIGTKRSGEPLDSAEERLLTSFAAQASLVLDRAAAEEERRFHILLQESDRLKSSLLSAVSHDLRTPLAAIKASATALLMSDARWTAEDGREFLEAIDHEADRLNRLVGNLLDLSRIEAGVLRPVLDWYDPGEIIDGLMPQVRRLVEQHRFSVNVAPNIPPVRLDLVRVEELLLNLIENAARYTPPGTPICLRLATEDGRFTLRVTDKGPGIPAELRTRIFDSFVRGREHSDHDRGTGLGLAICSGIARALEADLRLEDTPGGGATFVLSLPAAAIAEPARA